MLINEVKISDAEKIAELEIALFPENCFNEQTLKREISIGGGLVAYQNGELLGYLLIRWDFANELMDIIRIGVRPTSQQLGIGTTLLKQALDNTESSSMLMAKKTNLPALRLYHRFGFNIVAQTDHSWVMVRLTC